MRKLFVFTFLFLIAETLKSQNTNIKNTGHINFKPFKGWYKDNSRLNQKELKNEMTKTPSAISYFKKAKTNQTVSYTTLTAMVACIFIAKSNDNQMYNKDKYQTFQIIGLTFGAVSIITQLSSIRNFKKASKTYNKNISTAY